MSESVSGSSASCIHACLSLSLSVRPSAHVQLFFFFCNMVLPSVRSWVCAWFFLLTFCLVMKTIYDSGYLMAGFYDNFWHNVADFIILYIWFFFIVFCCSVIYPPTDLSNKGWLKKFFLSFFYYLHMYLFFVSDACQHAHVCNRRVLNIVVFEAKWFVYLLICFDILFDLLTINLDFSFSLSTLR